MKNELFREMAVEKRDVCQGYLNRDPERTVRVRIADGVGYLTVKGKNKGCVRLEFEYEIPVEDARQLLSLCKGRIIVKTRYIVPYKGFTWEVDEYHDDLDGLVVTEVELDDEHQRFPLAPFAGEEVTGDPAYYNSQL